MGDKQLGAGGGRVQDGAVDGRILCPVLDTTGAEDEFAWRLPPILHH